MDLSFPQVAQTMRSARSGAMAARVGEELLKSFPRSEYAERTRVVVGEAWFQAGDLDRARDTLAGLDRKASDASLRARAASRLAWCDYLDGDAAAASPSR